jgi:hypothetical protein
MKLIDEIRTIREKHTKDLSTIKSDALKCFLSNTPRHIKHLKEVAATTHSCIYIIPEFYLDENLMKCWAKDTPETSFYYCHHAKEYFESEGFECVIEKDTLAKWRLQIKLPL